MLSTSLDASTDGEITVKPVGGPLSHLTKTLVNKMRRRFSPGQNDDFNLLKEYQTQGSHPYIPGM